VVRGSEVKAHQDADRKLMLGIHKGVRKRVREASSDTKSKKSRGTYRKTKTLIGWKGVRNRRAGKLVCVDVLAILVLGQLRRR